MLNLSAKVRKKEEKISKIKEEKYIPGIIYGYNMENLVVKIEAESFEKIYTEAGESTLIKINMVDEDGKKIKESPVVLIQDTQEDPITGKFIHIDLYQPNLKEEIEVEVPLEFVGVSSLVKNQDGTLIKNYSYITIEALPSDLIHEIEIDISVLEDFDDVIKISDLKVPSNVKITDDPEAVIALVSRPHDLEAELDAEGDSSEPEVIGEKKEEDEEDDK